MLYFAYFVHCPCIFSHFDVTEAQWSAIFASFKETLYDPIHHLANKNGPVYIFLYSSQSAKTHTSMCIHSLSKAGTARRCWFQVVLMEKKIQCIFTPKGVAAAAFVVNLHVFNTASTVKQASV